MSCPFCFLNTREYAVCLHVAFLETAFFYDDGWPKTVCTSGVVITITFQIVSGMIP